MKKIIKLDELETKTNELINYSKNDIQTKIDELKKMTNDFDWKGPACSQYIEIYNNHINKLNNMNKRLEILASFLNTVFDNYTEANEELDKMIEEQFEEIKKVGNYEVSTE